MSKDADRLKKIWDHLRLGREYPDLDYGKEKKAKGDADADAKKSS